jgi:hypothetical protein
LRRITASDRRAELQISSAACHLTFTGCSGSQPPIGAPGAVPQSRAIATAGSARQSLDVSEHIRWDKISNSTEAMEQWLNLP